MSDLEDECRAALPVLLDGAERLGIYLNPEQQERFVRYATLLLETNRQFNLTAIRQPREVMRVLFLDSLTVAAALSPHWPPSGEAPRLADVGSGTGVPGLPLAILQPTWSVTLIESIGKKARFLSRAVTELRLRHVSVVNARAEVAGRQSGRRDTFDLVVARAVASVATLLELCTPLARVHGLLAFSKSGTYENEIEEARAAADTLRTPLLDIYHVPAELGLGEGRAVLVYRKSSPTPGRFPRDVGIPRSRPIGATRSTPDQERLRQAQVRTQ